MTYPIPLCMSVLKFLQILTFNRLYYRKGMTIFMSICDMRNYQNSLIQIQKVPWVRKPDCLVPSAANPLTRSLTMTNVKTSLFAQA